jgi:hypothetical protein
MKNTRRTMLSGSMHNHAWPKDMCKKTSARRQEKQGPDRASEATITAANLRS